MSILRWKHGRAPRALLFAALLASGCGGDGGSPTSPSQQASSSFSFISPGGDYIGGGQTRTFTPDTTTITASADCRDNRIEVRIATPAGPWTLTLAAPRGSTLAAGTYENARRYPFQSASEPGLDFYGEGRGCNQLTGRFVVTEVLIAPDGGVERLRATFQQSCENVMPVLNAEVRLERPPRHTPSICPT